MNSDVNLSKAQQAIGFDGRGVWSAESLTEKAQFLADVLCSLDAPGQGNERLVAYWKSLSKQFGELLSPEEVSSISSELYSLFLCYSGYTIDECPAYFVIDSLADSCAVCSSRESCDVTSLLELMSDQVITDGSPARYVFHRIYARMAVCHVLQRYVFPGVGVLHISDTTTRWLAYDLQNCLTWQKTAKSWQIACLAFLYSNALRTESGWHLAPRLSSLCKYLDARERSPSQALGITPEVLLPSGVSFSRMVTPLSDVEYKWQAVFSIPEVPMGISRLERQRTIVVDLGFFDDPTGTPEAGAMQSLVGIPCATSCYPADVHRSDVVDAILSRKETLAWLVALEACRLSFSFPQLKEHYNERNNKGVYFLLLTALCWFQRYRVDKAR